MDQSGLSRIVSDNGLTILLQEQDARSISFCIGVRFGSVHHPAAHFIEHLLFKGTESKSYQDIRRLANRGGGSLDAFTGFFSTCYVTKNLSRYAYEALELLCDMIANSTILESEIEHERAVVLEEHKMRTEDPELLLTDMLYRMLYRNHPLERMVLDDIQRIKAITHSEVIETYRKFYIPANIVIVGVGPIDKDIVLEIARKYFPQTQKESVDQLTLPPPETLLSPPSGRTVFPRPIARVHLMGGFRAVPCTHPDYYPLRVLSAIMGENTDSRLFEETRERKGLVYNITSHYDIIRPAWKSPLKADCTRWHGTLRIYSNFRPKNIRLVEKAVKTTLQRLVQQEVSEEELEANKQKLIGCQELALDGTFRYMNLLFTAEINDGIQSFYEFNEGVSAVTSNDVLRVARQYCNPNKGMWIILKPQRNS